MTSTCILNEIFVWTQVVNKLLLLFLSISGHFGRVYAGVLRSSEPEGNPTLVAIKTLKGDQLASRTKMAARLPGRRQLVDYFLQTKHLNVKPASNDFGCICEQIWKDQCSIEVYITINRTKWYCSKLLIKWVITTKIFFTFVMLLKWAAVIGCM